MEWSTVLWVWVPYALKVIGLAVFASFIPVTAHSFCRTRLPMKKEELSELNRIRRIILEAPSADAGGSDDPPKRFRLALGVKDYTLPIWLAFVIALLGLTALVLGREIGIARHPNFIFGGVFFPGAADLDPATGLLKTDSALLHYQEGALMVFGMAFLGAYLWGLQDLMRRYLTNDLMPGAYYSLTVRMIFAAMLALVIYHFVGGVAGMESLTKRVVENKSALTSGAPAVAFLIGMFPQRALHWLQDKITVFAPVLTTESQKLPLDMIHGVTVYDKVRLAEIGIDNCYDLANAEFLELMKDTPYRASELVDWMLQAKLCQYFGQHVPAMRETGVRTIADFVEVAKSDEMIVDFAKTTPLTESTLRRVASSIRLDSAAQRLLVVSTTLSNYAKTLKDEEA